MIHEKQSSSVTYCRCLLLRQAKSTTTSMGVRRSSAVCSSVDQRDVDRLSELPQPLIHHIFTFLDMKEVVQTCLLSRSWRFTWQGANNITHLPRCVEMAYGQRWSMSAGSVYELRRQGVGSTKKLLLA